jgi:signal transduction histidine kinase
VFHIVNEQTGRPLEEPVTRALRERRVVELANHAALVDRDGRTVPIEDSAAPILDTSGQVIGAVLVFHDVTEKRRAEEALRKAHDELEKRVEERTSELSTAVQRLQGEIVQRKKLEATLRDSESQVRFFAFQSLTAQETERKRIAGELHDSIASSLGAVRLRIERTAKEIKQGAPCDDSLRDIASRVGEINKDVRRIMADLRPSILDDLGILAALNWFCREYQKSYSHIAVEKQIGIEEQEVPDSLKTPIFRISQEAMNNASKHSQASFVNLSLQKKDGKLQLKIHDHGQGFDPETVKKGLGLSTMRERAQLSGGTFDLESAVGKGALIRVSWNV